MWITPGSIPRRRSPSTATGRSSRRAWASGWARASCTTRRSTSSTARAAPTPRTAPPAPRPLSQYGRSKWEGERALLAALPRALVVRTTVVYGPDRQEKNFVYQLIRNCRSGQAIGIPSDQGSSPPYNADLAAASVECCETDKAGVYHLAGAGVLDPHAFALLAC